MIQKGAWLTTSRLYAGVVLYTYVSTHFLNHALGLVSLDALEAGRRVFLGLWRNWPMTILLYGALLTHACVVLYTVYRRRTLRMPRAEAVQITFGLSIPLLMATHVVGTRGVHEQAGIEDLYAYVLYSLWVSDPGLGAIQATGLVVAWVHGCIGMHTWLKLKPWYRDWIPYTYAYALVMPLLALAGFVAGGKEVMALAKDPVWRQAFLSAIKWPGPQIAEWAYMLRDAWLWFISGLLVLVFGGRMVRAITDKARMQVAFRYPDGRVIRARPGPTVLEISRAHGIPHASVCGGRGRCSTCRVRVIQGAENLPSPSEAEMGVLSRVGMPEGVRLACQIRPTQDVTVVPLLPPSAQNSDAFARPSHLAGGESEIAILFADLRGFTAFSEKRLPFDLVFVMNQYFRSMGRAVESAGGTVDKFIGDGVMALFGVGKTAAQGARDALVAARAMADALDRLNEALSVDLDRPLKIGIGIHAGPAIVGEMGYARATTLTALGDAVNTASRLESMTKELKATIVVSAHVAELAGIDLSSFPRHEIMVRGRDEPMVVYGIDDPAEIPGLELVNRSA